MARSKNYKKSKKIKKKTKNTKEIITVANKIVKETQKYRKRVQKNIQKLSSEDKKKIIPHIRKKDKTLKRTRSGASKNKKQTKLFKVSKQILNEIKKYNRKIDSILQKYTSSFKNKVLKRLQGKKIKSGTGNKKVTFSDTVVEKTVGETDEFEIGEIVEYESSTNNRWIDAKVLAVRPEDGSIDLDVRKSADLARARKKTEDTKTDELLGAHIIGHDAGQLIAEIVTTMEFGGSSEDIARICHAHPTTSEAVKEAAMNIEGRAIHI